MQMTSRWRTAALVAAALFAGSIIGPPLVQAATASLVTIQGPGGTNKASVNSTGQLSVNPHLTQTKAGQVETAEADAGSAIVASGSTTCSGGADESFYTIPSGKALIITSVTFLNDAMTSGIGTQGILKAGPASNPCAKFLATGITSSSDNDGSLNQVFQPGIPVPVGDALGLDEGNNFAGILVYGYLVPASAVPASVTQRYPKAAPVIRLHH
jgi:hypothetical protein